MRGLRKVVGARFLGDKRGRDAKLIGWLDELIAECSHKQARNVNYRCDAKCSQLPKVL
jgi:hypothetical protein